MSTEFKDQINQILHEHGTSDFSIIPLKTPLSFEHYSQWIDSGFHGEMGYLKDNSDTRKNPQKHFSKAQSIIVFRTPYFPHPVKTENTLQHLNIAHYAKGKDYHFWFRSQLNVLMKKLKAQFPQETFLSYTDAVPLLERDHAQQAGLGWIGKNTCLIDRKDGSLFFIGEILTSLSVENKPDISPDFCGTCTACMDSCPTQAFESPRVLNASKCIAYWNIESKTIPPEPMREAMGDWFFGCDVCQTVCPWNIKLHKLNESFIPEPASIKDLEGELRMILESSNKKLLKIFAETPLTRAGGRGLKRNALIVIANKKITALKPMVESLQGHESLGELAEWTLSKLNS